MSLAAQRLFAELFLALLLASLAGWFLASRRSGASDNLNARIRSWWVMVCVGGLSLWFGQTAVLILFALLSLAALREYLSGRARKSSQYLCLILVPLQYLAVGLDSEWLMYLLIPVTGLLFGREIWIGLMLCVYGLSFAPAVAQPEWTLFLVFVVQASDVLQFLWGRTLGTHPVAPRISPSKTIEGLLGGVVSAALLGAWHHDLVPFRPGVAMGVALLITLAGFLSGLLLSAIKRRRSIKDWGTFIAGHGGVLDRIDSLCCSAPLFYLLIKFS